MNIRSGSGPGLTSHLPSPGEQVQPTAKDVLLPSTDLIHKSNFKASPGSAYNQHTAIPAGPIFLDPNDIQFGIISWLHMIPKRATHLTFCLHPKIKDLKPVSTFAVRGLLQIFLYTSSSKSFSIIFLSKAQGNNQIHATPLSQHPDFWQSRWVRDWLAWAIKSRSQSDIDRVESYNANSWQQFRWGRRI